MKTSLKLGLAGFALMSIGLGFLWTVGGWEIIAGVFFFCWGLNVDNTSKRLRRAGL